MKLDLETLKAVIELLKRHGLNNDWNGSKAIAELQKWCRPTPPMPPRKNGHP